MLNKDQYNQEEYNDYYRQETEGAELGGTPDDETGGLGPKLILILVLLAIAIAGYFGYKAMDSSATDDIDTSLQVTAESSLPMSVQEESNEKEVEEAKKTTEAVITKEEAKDVEAAQDSPVKIAEVKEEPTSVKETVTTEVTKVLANQGKMSPEEVAALISVIMQKMNNKETTESSPALAVKKDVELMDELSDTKVDSVSADLIKELENIDISENTKVNTDTKQVDVYNKVNVQNVSGNDTLSQLSGKIGAVINEEISTDKTEDYTKSLKNEVDVRQNEMRIIVVRKGDTLGKIAKRAYGNVMDYKKIYRANPEVTRPDRIYIGQKLRIPNE